MLIILILWIVIASASFAPLCLAAWRARAWSHDTTMRWLVASLIGMAYFQALAGYMSFAARNVINTNQPAPFGLVLFTSGDALMTIPFAIFALKMLTKA